MTSAHKNLLCVAQFLEQLGELHFLLNIRIDQSTLCHQFVHNAAENPKIYLSTKVFEGT